MILMKFINIIMIVNILLLLWFLIIKNIKFMSIILIRENRLELRYMRDIILKWILKRVKIGV